MNDDEEQEARLNINCSNNNHSIINQTVEKIPYTPFWLHITVQPPLTIHDYSFQAFTAVTITILNGKF